MQNKYLRLLFDKLLCISKWWQQSSKPSMRSYEISQVACTVFTKGIVICLLPVNSPNIVRQEFKKKNGKGKRKWRLLIWEWAIYILIIYSYLTFECFKEKWSYIILPRNCINLKDYFLKSHLWHLISSIDCLSLSEFPIFSTSFYSPPNLFGPNEPRL